MENGVVAAFSRELKLFGFITISIALGAFSM